MAASRFFLACTFFRRKNSSRSSSSSSPCQHEAEASPPLLSTTILHTLVAYSGCQCSWKPCKRKAEQLGILQGLRTAPRRWRAGTLAAACNAADQS